MVEFRDRVAKAMEHAGLSAPKLAEKMKVRRQAVEKLFRGESNSFTAENTFLAADACGVSARWLALGVGEMVEARGERAGAAPPHPPAPVRPWPLDADLHDRLMALDKKWLGHIEIKLDEAITECEARSGKEQAA